MTPNPDRPSSSPDPHSRLRIETASEAKLSSDLARGQCYDFSLFLTPTRYRTDSRAPIDRRDSYL